MPIFYDRAGDLPLYVVIRVVLVRYEFDGVDRVVRCFDGPQRLLGDSGSPAAIAARTLGTAPTFIARWSEGAIEALR